MRRKVRGVNMRTVLHSSHLGVGVSRLTAIYIRSQVRGHTFSLMTFPSQKAPLATKTNISTNAIQINHMSE